MPIYEQTYRAWDAQARRRAGWLVVASQELRVAKSAPIWRRLFLVSLFPFIICFLAMVVADLMTTNPSVLFREFVRQVRTLNVNAAFFRMYILLVMPFAFLFCLLMGSGSICNDYRHNLLEVYFAKPLRRFEYFIGKLAAVCYMPLCLTAGATIALYVTHLLCAPSVAVEFVKSTYWVLPICILYSFLTVAPMALFVMACSALSRNSIYASVIACAVLFMNSGIAAVLAEMLDRRNIRCWGFIRAGIHLADEWFGARTRITVHWGYIVAGFAILSLVFTVLILRRIRAVEIGS
jgi:ABC-type transport system involved in multi-copper enzyme maturation permease subunit